MTPMRAFMLFIDGEPSPDDITTSLEWAARLLVQASAQGYERVEIVPVEIQEVVDAK